MKNAVEQYMQIFAEKGKEEAKVYFDKCTLLMDDDIYLVLFKNNRIKSDLIFLKSYYDEHMVKFGHEFICEQE